MSVFRTNRNDWPYTTPSGRVYEMPTTYEELKRLHDNASLASLECNDEPEHPPEPRWEHLGPAHRRIEQLERQVAQLRAILDEPDPPPLWRPRDLVTFAIVITLTALITRWWLR